MYLINEVDYKLRLPLFLHALEWRQLSWNQCCLSLSTTVHVIISGKGWFTLPTQRQIFKHSISSVYTRLVTLITCIAKCRSNRKWKLLHTLYSHDIFHSENDPINACMILYHTDSAAIHGFHDLTFLYLACRHSPCPPSVWWTVGSSAPPDESGFDTCEI